MGGLILLGIYLTGNVFRFIFPRGTDRDIWKKKIKTIALIMFLCVIVSLINPYGYHILVFPFKLTSNKFIMDNINEFLPPNFHQDMPFKYLFFLMIAILAISMKSLNIIETLLTILFTYMALYSARYIPLFAIIVAPILLNQIETILADKGGRLTAFLKKRAERIASMDMRARGYLWPVLSILLVAAYTTNGKIDYKFDKKIKPVAAVEFLKREKIQGNMFNNDEFGDYIIYAAWPEYRVFFDGRSDMYGAKIMKEYFKIARLEPGWEDVIKKYDINWIIYNANSPLSLFLMERRDWKLIYADKVANIFVKDISRNQYLINKYRDVKLVIEKADESR
ncbi:MAG: hypothetical protein QMD01_04355 [Thermodesulfovibrionales bacterium]|nr:hypothetical protein [Thermodesulfovibrionales bacterium]